MADDFVPQSVLAGNLSTTTFTLGQGNWARRWGRTQPVHGTASSAELIVAEVREDVYTEDAAGLAYDSNDTTWVRCLFLDDSTVALREGELRLHWMGVPKVLPAGYTARHVRNLAPSVRVDLAATSSSLTQFLPAYTPTLPVRTADGIYLPMDDSETYAWGPWNRDNLIEGDNTPLAGRFDSYGLSVNIAPAGSGVPKDHFQFFAGDGSDMRKHPGYRSCRAIVGITDQFYTGLTPAGVAYPEFQSITATIGISTGATVNLTTVKADLVWNATQNMWVHDHGNLGSLLAPLGEVAWWDTMDYTCNYTIGGSFLSGIGGSFYIYMCPRVDIPLPFTSTYGNLVAPGGILTGGNVPGF
jgi:hypothetical protein